MSATYAAAVRVEAPSKQLINAPPDPRIPVPDFLKVPGSANSDDGDRNFKQGSLINNRLSLLGELLFKRDNYGALVRGDAFYDNVYFHANDNNSPDTVNKTGNVNRFTADARRFDGRRARLLDAYGFGTWNIGDSATVNLRVGQQVVAWGESLFFSGISLAQGPADGAIANVPGADVKSILLPVNQIGLTASLGERFTLLGQYKLAYKATEVNPVGEYFSSTDVVGPGAQFAYGIRNPLYANNLAGFHPLSNDLVQALQTVGSLFGLPANLPINLPPTLLSQIHLPATNVVILGAPKYINVPYAGEVLPSDFGQYSVGLKYKLTTETEVGVYRLRYADTNPVPVFTYGFGPLTVAQGPIPAITTQAIGLKTPISYQVEHFAGVDMTAASFSTSLLGASVAGELIYRDKIPVLVDVNAGVLGPVPTPTKGKISQIDLNAIYLIDPGPFWDGITLVGDVGAIHVNSVNPVSGPDPSVTSRDLTYSKTASAASVLISVDRRNVFEGWDLTVPLNVQGVLLGQSSLLGGFGALAGPGDIRGSLGTSFTYLQRLSLSLSYNAFLGSGNYTRRPLADRDYVAFSARYGF